MRRDKPKIADLLLARLRQDGLALPEGSYLTRLYTGYWQRCSGAWSWSGAGTCVATTVGSQFSMWDCLRAEKLNFFEHYYGMTDIDPSDEDLRRWKEEGKRVTRK